MTGTPGKLDDFISTDKINLSQVVTHTFSTFYKCKIMMPFLIWNYTVHFATLTL